MLPAAAIAALLSLTTPADMPPAWLVSMGGGVRGLDSTTSEVHGQFDVNLQLELWRSIASIGVGFGSGFADVGGRNLVPLSVYAFINFREFEDRFMFPIIPTARAGVVYLVNHPPEQAGYQIGAGIDFILDRIEKKGSRSLDTNWGIEHSSLYVDTLYTQVLDLDFPPIDLPKSEIDRSAFAIGAGLRFYF